MAATTEVMQSRARHAVRLLSLLAMLLLAIPTYPQQPASAPGFIVEQIEIIGNRKTRPVVILDRLSFHVGDTITPATIEQDWASLIDSNFFKSVEFYTRPGSTKGAIIVVIEVEERRGCFLQFAGGHSDLGGWYFVPISLRFDNLLGYGNRGNLQLYFADRASKLSLQFTTYRLFDASAYLSLELYGGTTKFIHYIDGEELLQDVGNGGLQLRFGGNRGLFRHLFFGFSALTFNPKVPLELADSDSSIDAGGVPPVLAEQFEKTKIATIALGLQADTRDNPIYPQRGAWGALVFEKADRELGSDLDFERVTLDARFYQRTFGRQVLALNLRAGYASDETPFYQRFYLGGANSLRGYPERRLTPIGYGNRHALASLEYRVPFSPATVERSGASLVLFFESGGLWEPGQQPFFYDLYHAAGFGFRFKVPIIGLTRLDFAFPFDRVDDRNFKLHFSLGQTF